MTRFPFAEPSAHYQGRTDHLCRTSAKGLWQPDPLLMDERMLVAHVREPGIDRF